MMKKIDLNITSSVNINMFPKDKQEFLRSTKEIKSNEYGDFVEVTLKEQRELMGYKESKEWAYILRVKYDGKKLSSYDGVVISKINSFEQGDIIEINSGNLEKDEEMALFVLEHIAEELEDEYKIYYSSSYDDYVMDSERKKKKSRTKTNNIKNKSNVVEINFKERKDLN